MKTTFFLSAIATFFAASANATCFGSGEDWGDRSVALTTARNLCNSDLTGTYGPGGTTSGYRGACRNGNGKKLEFQLWHIQGGDRYISPDECYDGFQKEINGCSRGGDTSYTNWRYSADPNAGSC
ncbi:hypothetical protein QBC35DRAFT_217032 [Podospora australis]|uniref:Secreted protein n=1 Tax=Podospora australis TaxID=1536484 RepID=A0AAN6WH91_9PEZI|nr:hypothetical protein QBC35DRAFT_217032 [Podospora australis]